MYEVLNLRLREALMIPGPGSSNIWVADPNLNGRTIKGTASKIEITSAGHFLIHVGGKIYYVPQTAVSSAQVRLVTKSEDAPSKEPVPKK